MIPTRAAIRVDWCMRISFPQQLMILVLAASPVLRAASGEPDSLAPALARQESPVEPPANATPWTATLGALLPVLLIPLRNHFRLSPRIFSMKLQRASTLLLAAGLSLYAAPRVIATGNPPLTDEMATKAAGFFEWLLDLRFTPAQQQEYQSRLARDWTDPASRQSTLDLLKNVDKLGSVPADRKQQVRASVLEAMQKATDEESRWLLAIYRAAHPPETASAPEARRLVGKWRSTKSSAVQYRSSTTGVMAPTNGSSFFYQFNPDGTYQFNGLMQITSYGCSTSLYSNDSGRYQLAGDRLTVQPEQGRVRTEQTCGSSGVKEKPASLDKRESIVRWETDSGGNLTLVLGSPSSNRPDYFRAER